MSEILGEIVGSVVPEPNVYDTSDKSALQESETMTEKPSTLDVEAGQGNVNVARLITPKHGVGKVWSNFPPQARTAPKSSPVAALRDRLREGFEKLLPDLLEDIAKGRVSKLAGMDLLAKYGIGATGSVTIVSPDVISRLEKQAALIASRPNWETADLLEHLREVWT